MRRRWRRPARSRSRRCPRPDAVAGVAASGSTRRAAGADPARHVDLVAADRTGSSPARLAAQRAPLRRGAAHRRRGRRREAVARLHGRRRRRAPSRACMPLLDQLGRATFHLGPVGAGTTMKLVNSLLAFTCTWASLEASVAGGGGRARPADGRRGRAHRRRVELLHRPHRRRASAPGPPTQFALGPRRQGRPPHRGAGAATASRRPSPPPCAVLADAVERGLGDHDWSDLVVAAEARTGLELTLGPAPEAGGARMNDNPDLGAAAQHPAAHAAARPGPARR